VPPAKDAGKPKAGVFASEKQGNNEEENYAGDSQNPSVSAMAMFRQQPIRDSS
jgi:hypothetical protein